MANAYSHIYVDPSIAADSGSGTRMTVTLVNATFTNGSWTLNETNVFTAYNTLGFSAGDEIYIGGGTNVTAGWYAIASITSNSEIVLTGDITSDAGSPTDVSGVSVPFGDFEWAIEQTLFNTTNGTQVNVKNGTDEIIAAEITTGAMADTGTTVAWAPTAPANMLVRGYTTVREDGGIGGISGGGSVGIFNSVSQDYIKVIDMHLHNCGSVDIMDLDGFCMAINVEVNNTSADGISLRSSSHIFNCRAHDIGGNGLTAHGGCIIANCHMTNGVKTFVSAMNLTNACLGINNIIDIDGASDGMVMSSSASAINNSIYSNGGTGQGIRASGSNRLIHVVINNIVEGFSGTGGIGYQFDFSGCALQIYGNNSSYNNTTDYVAVTLNTAYEIPGASFANEVLGSSAFVDAANGDFSPVDTGNVKEGSWPPDMAGQ